MADDDHGARIIRQMVLEPQRAFEIEIVGGLVEQQQIGRRKQRRGERHAHAPAAGEFRAGAGLIGGRKSEAGQDRGRARRRRMGVDVDEAGLDFGDPVRIVRGFGFAQQRVALEVGLQHDVDQAFGAVGRFLREAADAPARRNRDAAGFERQVAADRVKQRRFADAVAADKADARAGHDLHGAVVDQKPPGDPDRNIGDGKHAALSPEPPPNATHLSVKSGLWRAYRAQCSAVVAPAQLFRSCSSGSEAGFGRRLCCSRSPTASQIERRWSCRSTCMFVISGHRRSCLKASSMAFSG